MVMVVCFHHLGVLMKSVVLMIMVVMLKRIVLIFQDESDCQNMCWNLAGIDSIGHNLHPALKSCHLET